MEDAVDKRNIGFVYVMGWMQERLAQISISCEEKKTSRIFIKPSYGIQAGISIGGNKVSNAGTTMRVAHGRDIAGRFVENEVCSAGSKRHRSAINFHAIDKWVDLGTHFGFHFAVNGDPACSHQVFGATAACNARTR